MKRRNKWSPPNNPTTAAKQVWRAAYGEPWPTGWRVAWAGFMRNTLGLTIPSQRLILLSYADAKRGKEIRMHERDGITGLGCIGTLLHEFTHVRNRGLRHGAEFSRLVKWAADRLRQ